MKVNFTTKVFQNKIFLKSLEKISEHGTSFAAGTSLLMSVSIRPIAIWMTPDTEKENKQYAATNSICSGLIKFGMVEAIALPIENAVKRIDQHPEKFLKMATIKRLSESTERLNQSRSYKLLTQTIKLSTGLLTAIPKSMLTIALIPIIMNSGKLINNKRNEIKNNKYESNINKHINFTGNLSNKISKGIARVIDNKKMQNFAIKFKNKDKDVAKHITAGTDILLTTSAAHQINNSKKIKENRKKALIYNNVIATAITLAGGYSIDSLIQKPANKFIEHFKHINASDPKLGKYIEGLNIIRPAIIFAGIYYGILPIFSTYLAEKIDKFIEKRSS